MLVAVLTGPDVADYYELTRLAPIQFFAPPTVWLSRPDESVDPGIRNHLNDEGSRVQVRLKPVLFRHLYNQNSGIPGYYAAMMPDVNTVKYLRQQLGILQYEDAFVPHMLLCHDGMRSQATKKYCRAIADALVNRVMTFEVFYADKDNPAHEILFQGYNESATEVFGHAFNFQ